MSYKILVLLSYLSIYRLLTLYTPIPQNGQTHSNNLPVTANELFECVTILRGWRLKG